MSFTARTNLSRRRLLSQHRRELAIQNMQKLAKKTKPLEEITAEIDALAAERANDSKGTWAEVFDKSNRVRASPTPQSQEEKLIETGSVEPSWLSLPCLASRSPGRRSSRSTRSSSISHTASLTKLSSSP